MNFLTRYCNEHALKSHLSKAKQGSRYPPPRTAEVLLHSLSHYVRRPRNRTNSLSTQYSEETDRKSPDEGESKITKTLDPLSKYFFYLKYNFNLIVGLNYNFNLINSNVIYIGYLELLRT